MTDATEAARRLLHPVLLRDDHLMRDCEAVARAYLSLVEREKDPVFAFLLGEGPLDGQWFGDRHPSEKGAYWWRKHLHAALASVQRADGRGEEDDFATPKEGET